MNKFWSHSEGPLRIDPERLLSFLKDNGIYKYVPPKVKDYILVKVEKNIVHTVSPDQIREYCWKYVKNMDGLEDDERRQVLDQLFRNTSLFNRRNMSLLQEIDLNEVRDTDDKSYLFFNSIVLEITAEEVRQIKYEEIEGHVFMSDVIDADFNYEFNGNEKPEGEFYEFLKDICKHQSEEIAKQNLDSLLTIIGYLIHRYKDPANAKAMIFMDTYKDDEPNGGTGKGLMNKAFTYVRPSSEHIDGKLFKNSDKFALSDIKYGTRIVTIDDVPGDFNFEKIFPMITEKAVVERKYENKFSIPFEDSPKLAITTNYTVEGKGYSNERRKVEFIFSETYNAEYTPEVKFGHLLYIDWSEEEWEKFFKTIIYALQAYLLMGLIKPKFNVAERKLKQTASTEFIDLMTEKCFDMGKTDKRELYESFYTKFPKHPKIELNTFTRWIKLFADAYDFKVFESHSGEKNFIELT